MPNDSNELLSSPPVVAIAGWLVPGSGYVLLGQTARGITISVAILFLFITGLLIAGVRVVEVPGYDAVSGQPIMAMVDTSGNIHLQPSWDTVTGKPIVGRGQWIMSIAPMSEIRNKLWAIPQALTGPVSIVAAAASVHAAELNPDQPDKNKPNHQLGSLTHSRINEIGALYLSVAGLLNLMAIIDSAWRASQMAEARAGEKAVA